MSITIIKMKDFPDRTTDRQAEQLFRNILLMIYFLTLGINGIRNALNVLNMLLPEPLLGDKITGHSPGRKTLVTAAVNSGIDATVLALTSEHNWILSP